MSELENRALASVNGDNIDQEIDAFIKDAGITNDMLNAPVIEKQKQWEQARLENLRKSLDATKMNNMSVNAQTKAADIGGGLSFGARELIRNSYNGIVDLADAVENTAAEYGIGTDMFKAADYKWTDPENQKAFDSLGSYAQGTKAIFDVVAPVALTWQAGPAVSVGADMLYNFLAVDPGSKNIADMVKGTWAEAIPGVVELQKTPYDSEAEARLKNSLVGGAFSAAAVGAANVFVKYLNARKGAQKVVEVVENTESTTPSVVNNIDNATFTGKATTADNVPAQAPKLPTDSVPAVDAQDVINFEQSLAKTEWFETGVRTSDNGAQYVHPQDADASAILGEAGKQLSPEDFYKPITDTERAELAAIRKQDPNYLENYIARLKNGDTVPDSTGTLIIKSAFEEQAAKVNQLLQAIDSNNVEEVVAATRALENLRAVANGTASGQGAALRAVKGEQLLAALDNTDPVSALKSIGNKGRTKLAADELAKHGGIQASTDLVNKLKAISQIPDDRFTERMGEIILKSKWQRLDEAVNKVFMNGMLMGKSAFNAATGSTTAITKYNLENYITAFNPLERMTLAQANAQTKAMVNSFGEALGKFGEAWKTGGKNTKFAVGAPQSIPKEVRVHLARTGVAQLEDTWIESLLSGFEKTAYVASGGEVPTKLLISTDAMVSHVISRGSIASQLAEEGIRKGLSGEELARYVTNTKPSETMLRNADQLAQEATLQNEVVGVFAPMADATQAVANKLLPSVAIRNLVTPFIRPTFNAVDISLGHSAFMFSPTWWKKISSKDPYLATQARAQATLVLATAGALVGMTDESNIQGLYTKEQRTTKGGPMPEETSLKIGGKWVSFKGNPYLAPVINFAAAAQKVSGSIPADEYAIWVMGFGATMQETMGVDNAFKNITSLISALTIDNEKEAEDFKAWAAQVASRGIPGSAGLKAVKDYVDPINRKTNADTFVETFVNRFYNMVPGLSKELPADLNRYGEPIKPPAGFVREILSPIASSDKTFMKHKKALENLMLYHSIHGDNLMAGPLTLRRASKSIDVIAEDNLEPINIGPMAVNTRHSYELTPMEYSVYQMLSAGLDPATGNPMQGGALRDNELQILKKYDLIDKDVNDITPQVYNKAVTEIHTLQMQYEKRAKRLIRNYEGIQDKMNTTWRDIKKFNNIE